uniref:Uncharacterized protein n=1 Tax=Tanacetum cinerariifolium TaxID=118510 RepID=A0A6L2JJ60_TANCI|nr:hypothetical protein CTI12_AA411450 [Tanacetum cinerariifolium]
MAMRKLNTSTDILEVMGAPLTGVDLRAYVMRGGSVTLKNFKAGLGSKRCFLIFPTRGSDVKGLVSVEVKNKKGHVMLLEINEEDKIVGQAKTRHTLTKNATRMAMRILFKFDIKLMKIRSLLQVKCSLS